MDPLHLKSTQNTSVNRRIWLFLSLLFSPKVILVLSGGHCIVNIYAVNCHFRLKFSCYFHYYILKYFISMIIDRCNGALLFVKIIVLAEKIITFQGFFTLKSFFLNLASDCLSPTGTDFPQPRNNPIKIKSFSGQKDKICLKLFDSPLIQFWQSLGKCLHFLAVLVVLTHQNLT